MYVVCEELCSSSAPYAVLHHMLALYLKDYLLFFILVSFTLHKSISCFK